MNTRHAIDEAVFDISFPTSEAASDQHELAAFIQDRLLPLADEIFGEFSKGGKVARIDVLEVDLGDVPHSGFKEEMEWRFKEKLRAALQDKIAQLVLSDTGNGAEGIISAAQAELEHLKYFLKTGRMPKNAPGGDARAMAGMLERALRNHTGALGEFLMGHRQRAMIARRLARQFPEALLAKLLAFLSPGYSEFFAGLSGRLDEASGNAYARTKAQTFRQQVFENMLGELMQAGGGGLDPARLYADTVERIRASPLPKRHREAVETAAALGADDAPWAVMDAADALAPEKLLAVKLEEAFALGRPEGVLADWPELIQHRPGLVRGLFTARLGDADLQRRMAAGFPEIMLRELAGVLDPGALALIDALAAVPASLARAAQNPPENKAALWKHLLGYLYAGQARGREAENARNLVRALANEGFDREAVTRAIVSAKPALETALAPEISAQSPSFESQATERARRVEALTQRLERRLGGAGAEPAMAQEIAELTAFHAETLVKTLNAWIARGGTAGVEQLEAAEARQLGAFVLRHGRGGAPEGFLDTIARHAKEARSETGYYRYILRQLMHGEMIDLKSAVLVDDELDLPEAPAPAEAPKPKRKSKEAAQGKGETIEAEALRKAVPEGRKDAREEDNLLPEKILGALLEEALALGRPDGIADAWGELIRNQSRLVREIFSRRLGDEDTQFRLAHGFPEKMLLELLSVAAPDARAFVAALGGQPELRQNDAEPDGNIKAAFWKYTLAYLHARNTREFDKQAYAVGLVRRLGAWGWPVVSMLQALSRTDSSLTEFLLAQSYAMAQGIEPFSRPETSHAVELRQRLHDRLSGRARDRVMLRELEELSEKYPEALEGIYRQFRAGGAQLDVSALTTEEARQHIGAIVGQGHEGVRSDFRLEIEAHAAQAADRRRYYQYMLEGLLRNRILDLEAAMKLVPDAGRTTPEAGGIGRILDSALPEGDVAALSGQWETLVSGHKDEIRAAYMRRLGDPLAQERLAAGFPEPMLRELAAVLVPGEREFIGLLTIQMELLGSTEAEAEKNRVALWKYTLGYLHENAPGNFVRETYALGMASHLVACGMAQGEVLRLLARADAALGRTLDARLKSLAREAERAPGTEDSPGEGGRVSSGELQGGPPAVAGGDEILQSIERRLSGNAREAVSLKLAETARTEPEALKALLKRAEAGTLRIRPEMLEAEELRLLVEFATGASGAAFRESIARHAKDAASQRGFYRHILEKLLKREPVDLEAAARETERAPETEEFPRMGKAAPAEDMPGAEAERLAGIGVLAEEYLKLRGAGAEEREGSQSATPAHEDLLLLIERRLSGEAGAEMSREIAEAARTEPEALKALLKRAEAGSLRIRPEVLEAEELRLLVEFATGVSGVAFRESIARHAKDAASQRGYYRHILEKLLKHDAVDLEAAAREAERAPGTEDSPGEGGRVSSGELQGGPPAVAGGDEILQSNERRLSGNAREAVSLKLAETARTEPEALKALLKRAEAGTLRIRPEMLEAEELRLLVEFATGASGAAFRESIARHAKDAASQRGYYRHILEKLFKHDAVDLEAAAREAERAPETEAFPRPGTENERKGGQSAVGSEGLLQRLGRRLSGGSSEAASREIAEAARTQPKALWALIRRIQSGTLRVNLAVLEAEELRLLVEFATGETSASFRDAIVRHAKTAASAQGFYRHILEKLFRSEAVDLELAAQAREAMPEDKAARRENVLEQMPPNVAKSKSSRTWGELEEAEAGIYVANAGMVLTSPFLPQLFKMVGLTEAGRFKDAESAERAIHLLQFIVNASCDSPEFLLPLNKVMCGVDIEAPIVAGIEITPQEKAVVEGMLAAMIQNWKMIGKTTLEGLRVSFLQRPGKLQLKGDAWNLKVEQKGIDVLIDYIPWGYSTIKHSWMDKPVHVKWR